MRSNQAEKKRVLIIGHTYVTPVNRLKFNLMAEDQRFDFMLVTPGRWRNRITKTDKLRGMDGCFYRTVFVDVWFGQHPVTYLIPGLRKIIREFHPQLIYCEQELICMVSLQVAVLAKRIPVIYFTWENIDRKDNPYRALWPIRRLCLKKSIFMLAGSREAAGVLRTHGYRKSIYISPILGVSEKLFFPQDKNLFRDPVSVSRFMIGFVGRFVEVKDVSTLLKGVALLDTSIDWRLCLLGEGPEEAKYKELIQALKIESRVIFQGVLTHDQVPQFINSLDILVLPSKTTGTNKEQFGHVLIEAMACGVPVVGSSSGEIPYVIGDARLVFREGDARELARRLTLLYQDHELKKSFIDRGLKRVREKFTDQRIAANMLALFEIALGMKRITKNTLDEDLVPVRGNE